MAFSTKLVLYYLSTIVVYMDTLPAVKFEAYCWRDYEGVIPYDAFVAGKDRAGEPVYVGQALFQSKLIPGTISTNDNKVVFEWQSTELATSQSVKILSARRVDALKWVPTDNASVFAMPDKSLLVKGGFEASFDTYIGRIEINGETVVGKVICGADNCLGLYTANNGGTRRDVTFEILSYRNILETGLNDA